MTAALLVQVPATGFTAVHTATLASLPDTFRPVANGGAIVTVDGRSGWTERAALGVRAGARAVIVDRPEPDDIGRVVALRDLAKDRGVLVAVESPYAGSPTWSSCQSAVIQDASSSCLIDSVAVVADAEDMDRALLAQMAVVRPLLGTTTLRRLMAGAATLVTRDGDAVVSISVTVSVQPRLTLDVVSARVRWRIELPNDETAQPGRASREDVAGRRAERPIFCSSSRWQWRAVAARLAGRDEPVYDLDSLLLDLRLLSSA